LPLLCEVAVRAFPELQLEDVQFSRNRVLHVLLPVPVAEAAARGQDPQQRYEKLYGSLVFRLQHDWCTIREQSTELPSIEAQPQDSGPSEPDIPFDASARAEAAWCFGVAR